MNTHYSLFKLNAVAIATLASLVALQAWAEDDEAQALKNPTNTLEIGAINTPDTSAKFGEYNGLNKAGTYLLGNIQVRGGPGYKDNEEGSTRRWSFTGSDLGLSSRSLEGSLGEQGEWRFGFGYDELSHHLSDSYQTPYQGSMGGNRFTLPSPTFPISTTSTAVYTGGTGLYGANTAGTNNMVASQLANMNIASQRKNTSFNASMEISPRLGLSFDYNQLEQTGAKLMGFGSNKVVSGTTTYADAEVVSILPMPTKSKTDTLQLALNWREGDSHVTTSYHGSFFRNGYTSVGFQTFSGTNNSAMEYMTTAPDNNFHQLNLNGGTRLTPTTKLTGNLSYSRNTQNAGFVDPGMANTTGASGLMVTAAPLTSLNGLVVNTHADVKVTNQATKDLTLSAALKYDERDNQTASNFYNFNAISGQHTANYPNTPLSTKKTQMEFGGDYRIKSGHAFRLTYAHDEIERWCNNYASNSTTYPAGTNCVVAKSSREEKLDASYRMKASDNVDFKLGYGYSDKTTNADQYAITAFYAGKGVNTLGVTTAGYNGGDFVGFYPFFDATRTQNILKFNVNIQATDRLSFGLGARSTSDKYGDSTYGVKEGSSWSFNLDSTYSYQEDGAITAYVTQQHRQRDMTNVQSITTTATAAAVNTLSVPANNVNTWTNKLTDNDVSVGLAVKQGGLMSGKLELKGDLSYLLGKTNYGTQLNYTSATSGNLTCSSLNATGAPYFGTCGDLPTIRSAMTLLKLSGSYQIDKASKVLVRYTHQRLNASDYYYNGYQLGSTPAALMPTNQQPGNYNLEALAVSFIHSF